MHFHLPKPLHGWREFVGEVGIIVVGVPLIDDPSLHLSADVSFCKPLLEKSG